MCIIFIAINKCKDYPLVIAANRDEFHSRKSHIADFWIEDPSILGGRDLQAHGTWMALNKNGHFAAITNFRENKANVSTKSEFLSRGLIVKDFVKNQYKIDSFTSKLTDNAHRYQPFNLIYGKLTGELYYFSSVNQTHVLLSDGIHGLSNNVLNSNWPKVEKGINYIENCIDDSTDLTSNLFALLYDQTRAEDDMLPKTGLNIEQESRLSSIFIKSPHYGTRCSSIILVDKYNRLSFIERSFDVDASLKQHVMYEVDLSIKQ